MFKLLRLFTLLLLWVSAFPALAVDCQQIRAQFSCPAGERYPLHLSFDDGPAAQTPQVLAALKRHNINASFFVLAEKIDCPTILANHCPAGSSGQDCLAYQQCQQRINILRQTVTEGHWVGSHSYTHIKYSEVPPARFASDLVQATMVSRPYLNTQPPMFRLPNGDGWFNRDKKPHVLQMLHGNGYVHVDWQLSAFDWNRKYQHGDAIVGNVLQQMCHRRQGGIVVFHDGMDNKMHEGRLYTTNNIHRWLPMLACVADFKPMSFFKPEIKKR